MDTKKLIGTIIGVTMFAVLIAGATFAWLTFGTTVVETNVAGMQTMNFLVDYTKGTDITDMPMLDSTLVIPSQTSSLVVVMEAHSGSVPGHGSISLTTTSTNDLTKDGVVRWAICRDLDVETSGDQVDDVCGSLTTTAQFTSAAMNTGIVTSTAANTEIVLLNDAKIASTSCSINIADGTTCAGLSATGGSTGTANLLSTDQTKYTASDSSISYFIYFWFDGETIANKHKEQKFTGYIHADANQLQT